MADKTKVYQERNVSDIAAGAIDCALSLAGLNAGKLLEAISGSDFLDAFRKRQELRAKIEELVSALLPEVANRAVLFIDELDRCRPEFAMQLLEQTKSLSSFRITSWSFIQRTERNLPTHSKGSMARITTANDTFNASTTTDSICPESIQIRTSKRNKPTSIADTFSRKYTNGLLSKTTEAFAISTGSSTSSTKVSPT